MYKTTQRLPFVSDTKRLLNVNGGHSDMLAVVWFVPTGSDAEWASMPKADKSGIGGRLPEPGTGKRMSMSWDVESW